MGMKRNGGTQEIPGKKQQAHQAEAAKCVKVTDMVWRVQWGFNLSLTQFFPLANFGRFLSVLAPHEEDERERDGV